jgi:hypothetical protein
VPKAQFNERLFEYCAGFELQTLLGAHLVGGLPVIPSQVDQALAGYDSAYGFKRGRSLILQYKVPSFARAPWGRGAATFHLWGQPCYRSHLHWHPTRGYAQHNALVELANTGETACYCTPCFWEGKELRRLFAGGTRGAPRAISKTLFAPLVGVPKLGDDQAHSITYPPNATAFRLHSDASEQFDGWTLSLLLEAVPVTELGAPYYSLLLRKVQSVLAEGTQDAVYGIDQGYPDVRSLAQLAALLDDRVGAVLVLIPE